MDGYLSKPIRAGKLHAALEAVLGASRRSGASEEAVLDWSEALRSVKGDQQLLREVAQALIEEFPGLMKTMQQALSDGDTDALGRAAHTLKGAVRYFGAGRAFDHAYRLERMARDGNLDNAEEALQILEQEMARFTPVLLDHMQAMAETDDTQT